MTKKKPCLPTDDLAAVPQLRRVVLVLDRPAAARVAGAADVRAAGGDPVRGQPRVAEAVARGRRVRLAVGKVFEDAREGIRGGLWQMKKYIHLCIHTWAPKKS